MKFLSDNGADQGSQFMFSSKTSVRGGVWKAHGIEHVQALACGDYVLNCIWALNDESIEGHRVHAF